MITNELLMRFKNNLGFTGTLEHTWDDKFAVAGAKIGDTLRLREPVMFATGTNPDITSAIQDVIETQKTLVLNTQAVVAFQFSSRRTRAARSMHSANAISNPPRWLSRIKWMWTCSRWRIRRPPIR